MNVAKFGWMMAATGAILAGLILVGTVLLGSSAPQQAAGAAIAAAVAVIPYVFARAVEGLAR
jgi:hypothetical protein